MTNRALIVGLGSIGRRHLRILRELHPELDIRVLRHSGCVEEIEYSDGCYRNFEDACRFQPDFAVIASPASEHIVSAKALANAGTHLLIEKPISNNADGVAELISLARERDLRLQVGYNLRFLKTLQCFRENLIDGLIGSVYSVQCEVGQYLPDWRPGVDYRQSVSAQRKLGGGVLLELSHELDLLSWVFGDVCSVSAWIGSQGSLDIDVEDSAMLHLEFENKVRAQVMMNFIRRDSTRACTAVGEKGTLRWDALRGVVEHFDPMRKSWKEIIRRPLDHDESYLAQLKSFLHSVQAGTASEIAAAGEEGLNVVKVVDAARRSSAADGLRMIVRPL
ncbi:Gfo/Idh/MocA family oxidoreductase [Gammaproteobacteria bacterium]|nr:Gfo/Idh/MocA family oxidoreductase [Gammaproteobacteria bacterium]